MKTNMKKIAIVALVAIIAVGSYFVSGTYAKYTSQVSGNNSANVAKWSFVVNNKSFTTAESLEQAYTFDLFKTILDTKTSADETDVDDNLIAPGTKGEITLKIDNTSEVNATYAIAFNATNASNIPLEYSIDGTTWVSDIESLNIAASEAETTSTVLAMKTGTVSKTIQWRWAFVGTDSANYTTTQTDATDTALGFAANTIRPTVAVTATVTLTQVD